VAKSDEKPLRAADVKGLKYFEKLAPLLQRLHEVGCERDKAGNRDLHYDELCLFLLLGCSIRWWMGYAGCSRRANWRKSSDG